MRLDPLLGLTLVGLFGCAALAMVHPTEQFDPLRAEAQAGRNVRVDGVVLSTVAGDGWVRGALVPLGPDESPESALQVDGRPAAEVSFVWFRPPETMPLRGDRVVGQALVERGAKGVGLVFDGDDRVVLEPGPYPVAVTWRQLLDQPEAYTERVLQVRGVVRGELLLSASGGGACALGEGVRVPWGSAGLHHIVLERARDQPGWLCHLVDPTTVRQP